MLKSPFRRNALLEGRAVRNKPVRYFYFHPDVSVDEMAKYTGNNGFDAAVVNADTVSIEYLDDHDDPQTIELSRGCYWFPEYGDETYTQEEFDCYFVK